MVVFDHRHRCGERRREGVFFRFPSFCLELIIWVGAPRTRPHTLVVDLMYVLV